MKDLYKESTNTALERFMSFMQDIICELKLGNQYNPDFIAWAYEFIPIYLQVCKLEQTLNNKTLSNKIVRKIKKLLKQKDLDLSSKCEEIMNIYNKN